jgi:soluble lytic murein transglycosylase-like protein
VIRALVISAALCLLAGCGGGSQGGQQPAPKALPPGADAPLPRAPGALADALTATTKRLRTEIGAWRDRSHGEPPAAVTRLAGRQQLIYRRLERNRRLAMHVLTRLPGSVAGEARDTLAARRALRAIPTSGPRPKIRIGPAEPAGRLRSHYARAQRRFGVRWNVLAAVNFVESAFGRLRNRSSAGARGPMQFIPATWRAYGMGGDVDDPGDAILGAANYLHANCAPRRNRRALYAYNHSLHYVEAVVRLASRMRRDPRTFYSYYAWRPPRMN